MSDKVWEKSSKDLGIAPERAPCLRSRDAADVDIITFDLAQRIPVQLKIPKVREAVQRGVYFEINYSAALTGALRGWLSRTPPLTLPRPRTAPDGDQQRAQPGAHDRGAEHHLLERRAEGDGHPRTLRRG